MKLCVNGLTLEGMSVGSEATCIAVREMKLCFDIGQWTHASVRCPTVLVSHGHSDHAGALPVHARIRKRKGLPPAVYVVPSGYATSVQEWYSKLLQVDHGGGAAPVAGTLDIKEAVAGATVMSLPGNRSVRAVPVQHTVHALGYAICDHKNRVLLAFTGDTVFAAVLQQPDFLDAEVLLLECTYWDTAFLPKTNQDADLVTAAKSEAAKRGHTHWFEIRDALAADLFRNKHIVLVHPSARYSQEELQHILDNQCPAAWKDRVQLFPIEETSA